jgi:uncharacterized membrane protein YdbT with pleckstrin-like domain
MDQNTNSNPGAPGQPAVEAQDYSKPVAYDNNGNPLYARPPQAAAGQEAPQTVYLSRPLDPAKPKMSADLKKLAEESKEKYPRLNLSDGEYVITAVKRHPIGLLQIWGSLTLVALVLIAVFAAFILNQDSSPLIGAVGDAEQVQTIGSLILGGLTVLLALGGWAATYIYNGNRFYLTNESVIQEVQTSLFSKYEQTVSLGNVEDASYRQNNPLQMLLNYGSIRLSTQGDETTYRFTYVTSPKQHIATLNNAVEAFKNYRPVH